MGENIVAILHIYGEKDILLTKTLNRCAGKYKLAYLDQYLIRKTPKTVCDQYIKKLQDARKHFCNYLYLRS